MDLVVKVMIQWIAIVNNSCSWPFDICRCISKMSIPNFQMVVKWHSKSGNKFVVWTKFNEQFSRFLPDILKTCLLVNRSMYEGRPACWFTKGQEHLPSNLIRCRSLAWCRTRKSTWLLAARELRPCCSWSERLWKIPKTPLRWLCCSAIRRKKTSSYAKNSRRLPPVHLIAWKSG